MRFKAQELRGWDKITELRQRSLPKCKMQAQRIRGTQKPVCRSCPKTSTGTLATYALNFLYQNSVARLESPNPSDLPFILVASNGSSNGFEPDRWPEVRELFTDSAISCDGPLLQPCRCFKPISNSTVTVSPSRRKLLYDVHGIFMELCAASTAGSSSSLRLSVSRRYRERIIAASRDLEDIEGSVAWSVFRNHFDVCSPQL